MCPRFTQFVRTFSIGIALSLSTLHQQPSLAMQFSFKYLTSGPQQGEINGIKMDGTIEPGDYERLVGFVRSAPFDFMAVGNVYLDSNGGSVAEALKIARLVKSMYKRALVSRSSICLSSCFYIYAAAVERAVNPTMAKVGIHRPYYPAAEFARLSPAQAEMRYAALDADVRAWLTVVSVPGRYIEKMFSVSSKEMYMLNENDLLEIGDAAWYEELTIATCGPEPTKLRKYKSREAFRQDFEFYFNAREDCMANATRGDRAKVMDDILGGSSWRNRK